MFVPNFTDMYVAIGSRHETVISDFNILDLLGN